MGETLFIRIGSQVEERVHWLINGDEEIIASGELANANELKQLAEKASSREVVVFVPACDVAIKSLTVPSSSQRAMRLAAPFMLEDELAQDVEQLFFAFSDIKSNAKGDNCFLAALEKQQLVTWQQWLSDAGIFCKFIQPDALALPFDEEKSYAVTLGEQTLVRSGQWQAMSFEHAMWPVVGNKIIQDEQTNIASFSSLPNVPTELDVNYLPEELPLAVLANNFVKKFNLLQGSFQVKEKRSPLRVNWLWAAGLAMFAVCLNMAIKGAEIYHLSAKQALIEEEIIASYKQAFPQAKRVKVSTIRSLLKRKLAEVGSSTHNTGFLNLLMKLEPALAKVPQLKPQTIKFDGKRKEVRMQTIAQDYQYFEQFKVALEQAGLSVNLGAQNNQGDQISGSFSITDTSAKGRS